jgi:hypothetical protein
LDPIFSFDPCLSLAVLSNGTNGVDIIAGFEQVGVWPGGILYSNNSGVNWSNAGGGPFNSVYSINVNITANRDTNIYASTDAGVFLSTNDGSSWAAIGFNNASFSVTSLAIGSDDKGGTNLYAGTNGFGIRLSTNDGNSWTTIDSGLANYLIEGQTIYPVQALLTCGSNVFASIWGGGIYLSTNSGTSWNPVNTGLPNNYVATLFSDSLNLYAGTYYGGVCIRPLLEMITAVKNKQNTLPASFSLQQNYPNPFNPSTTIQYSVPKTSLVTIKVYDILGREVTTLVNVQKSPGNYSVQFSAARYASGIYFYRMQSGTFSETKKLLLLK